MTDDIRFAAGFFHLIERPEFSGKSFQPCLDFSPLKACVTVHVLLETGFQCFEEGRVLFP